MVLFDREEIIPLLSQNRLAELPLGVQGIRRDQPPFERQGAQQHLGGSDFLAFPLRRQLIPHGRQRRQKRGDQMQPRRGLSDGAAATSRGTPHRFAINDDLILGDPCPLDEREGDLQGGGGRSEPVLQGLLKRPRLQITHQTKQRPRGRAPWPPPGSKAQGIEHRRMVAAAALSPPSDARIATPSPEDPHDQQQQHRNERVRRLIRFEATRMAMLGHSRQRLRQRRQTTGRDRDLGQNRQRELPRNTPRPARGHSLDRRNYLRTARRPSCHARTSRIPSREPVVADSPALSIHVSAVSDIAVRGGSGASILADGALGRGKQRGMVVPRLEGSTMRPTSERDQWVLFEENREAVVAALRRCECEAILPAARTILDGFADFLHEHDVLEQFGGFPAHGGRGSIPAFFFCVTLLHLPLFRLHRLADIEGVLFRSPFILRLLGFTARQIAQGF